MIFMLKSHQDGDWQDTDPIFETKYASYNHSQLTLLLALAVVTTVEFSVNGGFGNLARL